MLGFSKQLRIQAVCAPKALTPLWENLSSLLVFCCTARQVPLCPSVPACAPRTHLFPNNWAINDTQTAEQQDLLLKDSLCICRSPGVSLSQSPCQSQLQSCHHSLPPRRSFHSRATQEPIKCNVPSKSFLSVSAVIVSVWLHSRALGQFILLWCSTTNSLSHQLCRTAAPLHLAFERPKKEWGAENCCRFSIVSKSVL